MTQEELQESNRRLSTDPMIFYNEKWAKITCIADIKPIYWISTYGRIYSESSGYVMEQHLSNCGYVKIALYTMSNKRVWKNVHRLVLMTFNYIDGCENMVCNHIDGNKQNNHITNLEWTSQQGNVIHAFEHNLRKIAEDASYSLYTNEQIHHICKCMQDGKSSYEIAEEVFNRKLDRQIGALLYSIYYRINWRSISKDYDFSNYPGANLLSDKQIERICKCLENDINMPYKDILSAINISFKDSKEYEKYASLIRRIKYKHGFLNISSKYNF